MHLVSECDELLRASGAWKLHRRTPRLGENKRAVLLELIDIFKYTISVAQIHGFTPEQFTAAYWEKSMVVRQRYSEEFVTQLNRPTVVVDIDNVLADYVMGFLKWCEARNVLTQEDVMILGRRPYRWITPEMLDVPVGEYNRLRHEFRVSGEHARLPPMPGAGKLLEWINVTLRANILLLTSRPIDLYPNLYTETLQWINNMDLPYTALWWTRDKGEILLDREVRQHILFAVDDEYRYVEQLAKQGIFTFWLGGDRQPPDPYIERVASLNEIPERWNDVKNWRTK